MSDDFATLTIDGKTVAVPPGTLLVEAAKKVGVEIPVFCYHPKLDPVGMCRMCLVEVGRPQRDRSSGEPVLDENGDVLINFGRNLETACTLRVEDGWVVKVNSPRAIEGRKQIVEYLLTSHPLDCPICDKGGECPLQDQTMEHGPGKSRFLVDDKMRLQKNVPLGDLIFLDRERCIQCARCVRFQDEIVDDPVLGFSERGRKLEIVTFSDPPFDSYFSGNTTDICPVGALTTADFRFGARPWELNAAASICPHCPVGCNIVLNTRREAKAGGGEVVKRVMPRQNEGVNEIWICDKGRFAYHFALSAERLSQPLVRKDGALEPVSWEEAISTAAEGIKTAESGVVGIAGGRPSNEDLFVFHQLLQGVDGKGYLNDFMAGGDLVQKVGVGSGTNLGDLGLGDAVMVIASDLIEEAPIWWLRVKQAVERGASLIVANGRSTRLDKYASTTLRYDFGAAAGFALGLLSSLSEKVKVPGWKPGDAEVGALKTISEAKNLIVFMGGEGLDYAGSVSLSQSCASILSLTGHVGRPNNGLIPVWKDSNTQGAWDMGFEPAPEDLPAVIQAAGAIYVVASDPLGDLATEKPEGAFLIAQELFRTKTVDQADVVFPAQSFLEREGTYTSGERIVQRFYPAIQPIAGTVPDWEILSRLGIQLDLQISSTSAAEIMEAISKQVADYSEVGYRALLNTEPQWPHVGGDDLYFGGTSYENKQGLGIHLKSAAERGEQIDLVWTAVEQQDIGDELLIVPVTRLLDDATTVMPSAILHPRVLGPVLWMGSEDFAKLGIENGAEVNLRMNGHIIQVPAMEGRGVPPGAALISRSSGVPVHSPAPGEITPVRE